MPCQEEICWTRSRRSSNEWKRSSGLPERERCHDVHSSSCYEGCLPKRLRRRWLDLSYPSERNSNDDWHRMCSLSLSLNLDDCCFRRRRFANQYVSYMSVDERNCRLTSWLIWKSSSSGESILCLYHSWFFHLLFCFRGVEDCWVHMFYGSLGKEKRFTSVKLRELNDSCQAIGTAAILNTFAWSPPA